jgi:hypothetical protein
MNEHEPMPERLRELIDDYLDGLLDETRTRELEERLTADVDWRRYFVRYARLHTDLHLEARAREATERVIDRIERSLLASSNDAGMKNGEARMPKKRGHSRFVLRPWGFRQSAFAAAAGLLLSIGIGWWLTTRRAGQDDGAKGEPAVAWLVNAQNCQWADGAGPVGDLRAGTRVKLKRGLAEVHFACGARIVLEGPASLELLSGQSARLLQGKLTARVQKPMAGFEVLSPQGKVIDLGTEFGIAVADNGATEVYVFEGKVEACAADDGKARAVNLNQNQAARIADGQVTLRPQGGRGREDQFVRAIVPPPVVQPRTLRLTFDRSVERSICSADGSGTGLTHRLPGTGDSLPKEDLNLQLHPAAAQLTLTTTRSDVRNQVRLEQGEYLGIRLSDLGFTGKEDFAVTAVIPNTPALEDYGQFGLYAGTKSDRNIRGGLIKWGRKDPGQNTQFLVNDKGGDDTDLYKVGLLSPGTTLRLTLRRTEGKYSLTVENLTDRTDRGASTLTIRHPEFLDGEPDLFVGLFGANPYSDIPKTVVIKEFSVTVWTVSPPEGVR